MLISHSQILIISHSQFTSFLGTLNPKPLARLAILEEREESQVKNRNFSWLTANLSRFPVLVYPVGDAHKRDVRDSLFADAGDIA